MVDELVFCMVVDELEFCAHVDVEMNESWAVKANARTNIARPVRLFIIFILPGKVAAYRIASGAAMVMSGSNSRCITSMNGCG
jgi:hypothetical protein